MVARILVAEDQAHSLTLMLYLLKGRGYSTLFATDGAEALHLARDERPDLIVCELRLPSVDGYQVARQLRRDDALRRIPLLAISDLAVTERGGHLSIPGFDGYYAKPIDPQTFVPTVEQHLPPGLKSSHQPVRPRGRRRKTDL